MHQIVFPKSSFLNPVGCCWSCLSFPNHVFTQIWFVGGFLYVCPCLFMFYAFVVSVFVVVYVCWCYGVECICCGCVLCFAYKGVILFVVFSFFVCMLFCILYVVLHVCFYFLFILIYVCLVVF